MYSERTRNRCREHLHALAGATLDPEQARHEAIAALRRAIGFERWCWPLTDPRTVVSTNGIAEFDLWPSLQRLVSLEEHGDITSKPRLALSPSASISLSAAARGDLSRSSRWYECMRPYGIGDEVMTVCRDREGCWGSVELMRDNDEPPFGEGEVQFLDQLAATLGTLLRRALSRGADVATRETPRLPATLILNSELKPASWTETALEWLAELGGRGLHGLPPAVYELGARALTPPEEATGLATTVRIHGRSGCWIVVEGARLEGERSRVAVTIREAASAEIFDLLSRVHCLTGRERELVALVLKGLSSKEIAHSLVISAHTVQDHVKSIFAKTGVRTRGQLVSRFAGL